MASTRDKYVILVVGPCGQPDCDKKFKTDALQPLLEVPGLRVFTLLVIDISTAENLLAKKRTLK